MLPSPQQRLLLRSTLAGRLLAACFGAGVDSTAMLVALKLADLRPSIITFADLRAEKQETLDHLDRMNDVVAAWGWDSIVVCRKQPLEARQRGERKLPRPARRRRSRPLPRAGGPASR